MYGIFTTITAYVNFKLFWSIYVKNDCTETFIILFVLFILAAWVFHTERPVSHTDVFKANLSYLS